MTNKVTKDVQALQNKLIEYCAVKYSRSYHLKDLTAKGALNPNATYDEVVSIIKEYVGKIEACAQGKKDALKALGLDNEKRIGVTRYVIDVEFELRPDIGNYGADEGTSDCGTVMAAGNVMTDAIKAMTDVSGNKPISATLVAYRTDVEKATMFTNSLLS